MNRLFLLVQPYRLMKRSNLCIGNKQKKLDINLRCILHVNDDFRMGVVQI